MQIIKFTKIKYESGKPVAIEQLPDTVMVYIPVFLGIPYLSMMSNTLSGLHKELLGSDNETLAEYLDDLPPYPTLARKMAEKHYWVASGGEWRIERTEFRLDQIL